MTYLELTRKRSMVTLYGVVTREDEAAPERWLVRGPVELTFRCSAECSAHLTQRQMSHMRWAPLW